jgi:hypothetical protein
VSRSLSLRDDGHKFLTETLADSLVHRLTATLSFLIRLSPFYEDQLVPLLGVLQVGETLKGKLFRKTEAESDEKGDRRLNVLTSSQQI